MNKQDNFLICLLEETTKSKAIKRANISTATAQKYLNDKNFQKKLEREKEKIINGVSKKLQLRANNAVDVLTEIMEDKESPAYARLQSASKILDLVFREQETKMIDNAKESENILISTWTKSVQKIAEEHRKKQNVL